MSSNVTAVHVTVTTLPTRYGQGSANPTNYYDVCLLRFGDAVGYFDAIPIVGGPQWLAVPSGATRCGYAVKGGAVISLAEVIGGVPPFGSTGALSSLNDVAITSPADAQVLAYQASSSKWINSTPSGGSGGAVLGAKVTRSTTQSIGNGGAGTPIAWAAATYDTDTIWASGSPTRLTIHTAGKYIAVGSANWTGAPSGPNVWIARNGATTQYGTVAGLSAVTTALFSLAVSDYLELFFWQSSGSASAASNGCDFSVARIGA